MRPVVYETSGFHGARAWRSAPICTHIEIPMQLLTRVEGVAAWIATLLFTATGFFISYEVIGRYFFNAPTIWAAELSQLCLVWGSLIAMSWVLSARRHIRVTALVGLLPLRLRQLCEIISMALIAVFSGYVVWYGFGIFHDSFSRGRTSGTMLNLPVWIAEAAVPIGFALLLLSALHGLRNALRGELPPEGHGEALD